MSKKRVKGVVTDNHHLFYSRRKWKKGYAYLLRTHHYCIVQIAKKTLHCEIHRSLQEVPVPSDSGAEIVLEQLNNLEASGIISDEDDIAKRLQVLIALFDCVEESTANALRKQLETVHKFYHEPP